MFTIFTTIQPEFFYIVLVGIVNNFLQSQFSQPFFPFKFSWYGIRLNKHKEAMDIISSLSIAP